MRRLRIIVFVASVAACGQNGESAGAGGSEADAGEAGAGGAGSDPFRAERDQTGRWTAESAARWSDLQPWLVGCNFIPSTAVNQLEMWQEETFDPETIDRELGWAADLGFNLVRVFLHDLLWEQDQAGFVERIGEFLEIADRHGIRTMLVLFDNCWGPEPELGPQPAPVPGVHNSGWVQSPRQADTIAFADDPAIRARLEKYLKGVIRAFAEDPRVLFWDLLNEPGNSSTFEKSMPLLEASFAWAREVRPAQPLTAGVYLLHTKWEVSLYQIEQSDIVSFHLYDTVEATDRLITDLRGLSDRPLLCTEYLARTKQSLFQTHLPLFRDRSLGALNWGLVSGKTQTIYPWGSAEGSPEPLIWFHDIFRSDGTPFDPNEVEFIKKTIANVNR